MRNHRLVAHLEPHRYDQTRVDVLLLLPGPFLPSAPLLLAFYQLCVIIKSLSRLTRGWPGSPLCLCAARRPEGRCARHGCDQRQPHHAHEHQHSQVGPGYLQVSGACGLWLSPSPSSPRESEPASKQTLPQWWPLLCLVSIPFFPLFSFSFLVKQQVQSCIRRLCSL